MAVDVSPALNWKNKRKKSLYAEEAGLGFIFRKVNKTEAVKDSSEPVANGVLQPLLFNGDRLEPKSVLMNGHAQLCDEEAMPLSQDSTTEVNVSVDTSLLNGEELEEELHKEVELKRFLAQLKKDLLPSDGAKSEEEVDRALSEVNQDLKESGLYFKYMEADGPDELLPHPLTEQLREHIATLQASTERHTRELKEWDEVLERKRVELEHAKQNCESNKKINFSNLRPEDVAALKTYLTADQLKVLNDSPPIDTTFVQQATTQLEDIHSKLDSEVKGARENCQQMTEWLKAFAPDGESMVEEETPRTLFRSLKRGLV